MNEIADREAAITSFTGQLFNEPHTITYAGIRQMHTQARAEHRCKQSMDLGKLTQWGRRGLSAYTWTRTNCGPMKEWLHKIRKADDARCTACQHYTQDGQHIMFHCPALSI